MEDYIMRTDILDKKDDILRWVSEGQSKAYIAVQLRCKVETLNRYLSKMGIEYSGRKDWNKGQQSFSYIPAKEYAKKVHVKSSVLKEKLIREGIRKAQCEICGLSEWQNKKIPLELHHKNCNHFDNNFDNLQILCPNCHSQTENYGCKNHQMSVNPSSQEIPESVKKEIMDKVSEVGVVEARKQLSYRNSLINKVVKENHNIIVLISPNGEELEFPTIKGAAIYINSICGLGASVESVRSNLSNILAGRQKRCQGFTCYKKQQI